MVGIHGHGGDYDRFESLADELLDAGFAVASVDYRATPPNRWPTLLHDVNGAIRFLKAHADRYQLDNERFGIIGGSCGGHLSAFIAASNGDPAVEGDIGGNTAYHSNIKAAAIYYPWTDAFGFGEDIYHQYPGQMNKVMNSDGPYAPPGYMIDFGGEGKGMGNLKAHWMEPAYQDAVRRAIDISPVSHVTENSAPSVIVHGIFECGIQIPMNQSVRFFEALTRKGVKSLLLCNNNGMYGEDPEVRRAVVDFLKNRV
jgi:acetyl esterase/lipase